MRKYWPTQVGDMWCPARGTKDKYEKFLDWNGDILFFNRQQDCQDWCVAYNSIHKLN